MDVEREAVAMDEAPRVKAFHIPRTVLERISRSGGTFTCTRGLPAGARIIGVEYDVRRDGFIVGAEHPSFPPVELGEYPPVETVLIEPVGDIRLVRLDRGGA